MSAHVTLAAEIEALKALLAQRRAAWFAGAGEGMTPDEAQAAYEAACGAAIDRWAATLALFEPAVTP